MKPDLDYDGFIGTLPGCWQFDRLKDMVLLRNDKTDEASADEDYLELEDLESGTGKIIRRRNTLDTISAVTLFQKGDVLFGKLRPYLEKYYQAEFDGKCTGEILAFKPERIASRFLFYCIAAPWFIELSKMLAYGAKMPRVNWPTQIALFNLPLPPPPEQKRIAAYLDASCAAIDAAVAAKRRQLETLDALRKSTIQRVVTRGLHDKVSLKSTGNPWIKLVPKDWQVKALKRLAFLQTGLTLGKQYEGALIERPYLRVGNVQDGHLDLQNVTTIEVPEAVAAGVELKNNDVLMTEGGDLDKLGRGYLWEGQIPGCLHQNHIFAVRCIRHLLSPRFLTYLTSSKYGRDYFEATGKRTTNLASTNATKVRAFPIPLPPLPEQERLVAFLDEKLDDLTSTNRILDKQITTLLAYRKSLIHECVTGKRRITDEDVVRVRKNAPRVERPG